MKYIIAGRLSFSEDDSSSSEEDFVGLLHDEGNAHVARTRRQLVNRRIGAIGHYASLMTPD